MSPRPGVSESGQMVGRAAEEVVRNRRVRRAAALALTVTTSVVVVKLWAAVKSGSIAVLAEGLQSLVDIAMSGIALWSVNYAMRPPDEDHPYGHGKAELLSSAFQMVVVSATAALIIWQASLRLADPPEILPVFGLVGMGYAVLGNLFVIALLSRVLRTSDSPALKGEKEHQRADLLASIGVIGGLLAYMATGWAPIDPIVAIVFTAIAGLYAIKQLRHVLHNLMDGALPAEDIAEVVRVISEHPQAFSYHDLRTRKAGSQRIVFLHVTMDDNLSFVEAHRIAEQIESEISDALDGARVTIHYEPHEAELRHREIEH